MADGGIKASTGGVLKKRIDVPGPIPNPLLAFALLIVKTEIDKKSENILIKNLICGMMFDRDLKILKKFFFVE